MSEISHHDRDDSIDRDAQARAQGDDVYASLSDEQIKTILDAAHDDDRATVYTALESLSPADTADLLAKATPEDRSFLVSFYDDVLASATFTEMDRELCRVILSDMSAAKVAEIIADVESDDALLLIQTLDDAFQSEIIKHLSAKTRLTLEEGLSFPEHSAGRLMRREVVATPETWTVGKTIDYLRTASETLPENFFDVFIVSPSHHLSGELPLSKLVRARRTDKIIDLCNKDTHAVPATMDQEHVAHMFRREDIISAPVVDEDGRLIGTITIDDVVDVIDEEAQEDIMRMAGVDSGDLYRAVLSTANTRFRWLFINLLTAVMASIVISLFGATIEKVVALAILMPIVASMGGNAGTQALTVAVRAIATQELTDTNTARVIWKETLVGALNGVAFAVMIGLLAAFWFQSSSLGVVIAAAMIINLVVAGVFGAGIPLFLNKIGSDPAISSTVLLTTVTDVIGFMAFLGLASLFLV